MSRRLIPLLRQAFRGVRKQPGASVVIVLTLALGVGSTIAVFSVVEAFLLRPLGITDVDRVVRVREVLPAIDGPGTVMSLSPATYAIWRDADSPFESLGAATGGDANLTGQGTPLRVRAAYVSANFFDVLEIPPALGRTFAPGADKAGEDDQVVLGYGLWQRQFGGRRDVIGTSITLDGRSKVVIGVMPRGFSHPYEAEIWEPLVLGDSIHELGRYYLYAPARLKPGFDLALAQERLDTLAKNASAAYPDLTRADGGQLTPLRKEVLGDVAPVLYLLMAGALVVLVVSLVNITNLIVARHLLSARRAGIRIALGARMRDLLAPALVRYLLLAFIASAVALPIIVLGVGPLAGLSGVSAINEFDTAVRLTPAILAAVFGLVTFVGIALAFADAWIVRGRGIRSLWAGGGRADTLSRTARRGMRGLVLAQIVASLLLLTAGLSVMAGYHRLMHHDRGFDPDDVLTADVAFPAGRYADGGVKRRTVDSILATLRRLPGVTSAGATTVTPDFPGTWGRGFEVDGVEAPNPPGYFVTNDRIVTPGYLETMRIPLLRGRDIDSRDREGGARSVVVSRSFAEAFWPREDPIGHRVRRMQGGEPGPWMTIVGVAGDVEEAARADFLDMRRAWYVPCGQGCNVPGITFTLRTDDPPPGFSRRVQAAIHGVDPDLAVFRVMPLRRRLAETFDRELFTAILLGLFAFAGVAITVAGVYAVASISVIGRFKEIGIRVALGARRGDVARGLLVEQLALFGVGFVVALPILWLGHRLLNASVANLGTISVAPLITAAALLTCISCSALVAPMLLILKLNPNDVLKAE